MIPFATSGGSGMPYAEKHLRGQYPALAWKTGALVNTGAGDWARGALRG